MRKLAFIIMVFAFGMSANASDLSGRKNYGDKLPIVLTGVPYYDCVRIETITLFKSNEGAQVDSTKRDVRFHAPVVSYANIIRK